MKLLLCLLVASAAVNVINSAAVKGRLSASRPSQPFYATKSAPLVQAQQQEQSQEQEAALPAFVEPPAAPAPEPDAGEPMMPYAFEYTANGEDGTGSARRESNDGQRVTGTYTLSGADGVSRVVHYVADKDGYRATIITNEPGTESQSPAATVLQSSQLPAEQIALQYGPREPAVPAASARLLAPQGGVKGAPLRQGAVKAPIVQAPIVQVRAAPVKARLLPPPPPPPAAPRAPSKTRAALPPPPPPAPARIQSKTAPLRVASKTGAVKAARQPFYAATTTTTTTTTTTAAPTTEEVQQQQAALLLDEQQQQQEEQQEFAQLQQEPQQQQQQEEQELSQEVDTPQQQQQSAFFSS